MERSAIWLALVLPSIVYLKYYDVGNMSMVYIVLNASQSSSIGLLIWNAGNHLLQSFQSLKLFTNTF